MKYFKNTELAKLYNVSEKSVRNWIQAAHEGKIELQLYNKNDKFYVANLSKNISVIELLVEKGKKYKNKRGFRVVEPTTKFYDTFSSKQIFDIISNLTIYKELPLKYSYVDGGAEYWDAYVKRLSSEQTSNMFTNTVDLLNANLDDLARLVGEEKKINVIDLGPGNGFPVRDLLKRLNEIGRLKRYLALDVSQEMIDITHKNVKKWFNDSVDFEGHIRDFEHERFDDLLADDNASNIEEIPINLVLLLGGTLCNLRSPTQTLQAINSSLGLDDIVLYGTKLDTANSRRYFDFNISQENQELTPRHRLVLDMLNIDPSLYTVEQRFDEAKCARSISIRLRVSLSIEFKLKHGTRRVELNKDDSILLWRYWHLNALDVINQFESSGFDLQVARKTQNQEYLLHVSRIKRNE